MGHPLGGTPEQAEIIWSLVGEIETAMRATPLTEQGEPDYHTMAEVAMMVLASFYVRRTEQGHRVNPNAVTKKEPPLSFARQRNKAPTVSEPRAGFDETAGTA